VHGDSGDGMKWTDSNTQSPGGAEPPLKEIRGKQIMHYDFL
jgi:hypothetical protein